MRKSLLTLALAFAALAGVQAQSWQYTFAGNGDRITETIDGTEVTHYYVETPLYTPGEEVTGIRYTVMRTQQYNAVSGGGPYFTLGELMVLDADGNQVGYTATSNADLNTIMYPFVEDGKGLAALNNGNIGAGDYFHSIYYSNYAPADYHNIELTLETPVESFKLAWYTRPNQHNNCPVVVGISPAGTNFTADMLFKESTFSVGDKVASAADITEGNLYALYVQGPTSYGEGDEPTTGPGNIYISASSNSYSTDANTEITPLAMWQLLPADNENEFYIYLPTSNAYIADAGAFAGSFGGKNGYQYSYYQLDYAQPVKLTARADGDFELSYMMDSYYNGDGEKIAYNEEVWIGYDMRGNWKIFPADQKAYIEAGDYSNENCLFSLPVDFGFTISKVNAEAGLVQTTSSEKILSQQTASAKSHLESLVESAQEQYDLYKDFVAMDGESAFVDTEAEDFAGAIEVAQGVLATEKPSLADLTASIDAVDATACVFFQSIIETYSYDYGVLLDESEFCKMDELKEGTYPETSKDILNEGISTASTMVSDIVNGVISTLADAVSACTTVASYKTAFEKSIVYYSTFPKIYTSEDGLPGTSSNYKYNWESGLIILSEPVNGVRLTFLKSITTDSYNGYPVIALAEVFAKDVNGASITLNEGNYSSNSIADNDGTGLPALCDGDLSTYYHSTWWSGTVPENYVYVDVTFPEPMSVFSIGYTSRNLRCTPAEISLTATGVEYDPLLFVEDAYNAKVGDQITSVDQITDEGIYAIRGLLNTHPTISLDAETGELKGAERWYTDNVKYHNVAVNSAMAYFIKSAGDGTYTIQSLATAKYWPSMLEADTVINPSAITGYVSTTAYPDKAAKVKIVPATGDFENTFVIYEEAPEGKLAQAEIVSIEASGDEVFEPIDVPYVVYMDWDASLATRPVRDPQPWGGVTEVQDAWGDSLHFNKANGEGQWKIYKLTMDTPNYYWLTNLVNVVGSLGYRVGTDPGCVNVEGLAEALAAAQAIVADTLYTADEKEAKAIEAGAVVNDRLAAIAAAERAPMVAGNYVVKSAYAEYFKQQGVEKALYVAAEGGDLSWGNAPAELDLSYVFSFEASPNRDYYVNEGIFADSIADQLYIIKNVATGQYVGGAEALSTAFAVAEADATTATTYYVREANGSTFNIVNASNMSWNMHTNGHGGGAGTGSTIVYWTTKDNASAWYLESVSEEDITSIDDLTIAGDEVVSVSYYTVGGAPVSAPVKGINVVKVVYANGVVETKKLIVE